MLQLRIQTVAESAEHIEELLFNCGAVSIAYEDAADEPILEPEFGTHPLWSTLFMQANFTSAEKVQIASKALQNNQLVKQHIVLRQVDDHDWQGEFQQQFSPMKFGDLWIFPSWEDNPDPQGLSLQLDPGLAFGTGHHATTSLCLQWLSTAPLNGQQVVDFGCGSGILSLAAYQLGARHVYAIDIDPQALMATEQNIIRNQLPLDCFTIGNRDCLAQGHVDIIVANILAAPLLDFCDFFYQLLAPQGTLVVSGILDSQIKTITRRYASCFNDAQITRQDEWACISFQRN